MRRSQNEHAGARDMAHAVRGYASPAAARLTQSVRYTTRVTTLGPGRTPYVGMRGSEIVQPAYRVS